MGQQNKSNKPCFVMACIMPLKLMGRVGIMGDNILCCCIADATGKYQSMSIVKFRNNSLSGPLPGFVMRVPALSMDLSKNELTGPLPDWTGNPAVMSIMLNENQFEGPLPEFFVR